MSIRFAVIGLKHGHIFILTEQLLKAGAEITAVFDDDPELLALYTKQFPQVSVVESTAVILEDESVPLVIGAPIPNERAELGIQLMRHGKDFITDKPGLTTLEQLEAVRAVQAETQRRYHIYYCERFANPATIKADELVQAGAIGQVIHMTGMGPHRMNPASRPDWFFRHEAFGGILNDLACHQVDQFLTLTNSQSAEVVSAHLANYQHKQYPEVDDFGEMLIRSDHASAHIRVDWFTPDGLGVWGDVRLFLTGTDGMIEVRKNIDVQGRPGDNHLFLVNHQGQEYIDCRDVPMPYGEQIIYDVLNRTETATTQAQCFLAAEIALRAQAEAHRLA